MPRIGRAAHEVSFQEPGGHEPGRRIDTIDRRCDRDPLRGPGPERSRQQAEGIDPAVPLVAGARPRQAHEGDQVAGDVGGGVIGACAGLGEPDHRVLDDRDVGVAEHGPQPPGRRVVPLVEADGGARLPVPGRQEPDGLVLRRQAGVRPNDELEVTLEGDAGFVPAVPGIDLLPEGCSTPGWPPPGGSGEVQLPPDPSRPPALLRGLPTTVVCDLGELAPGNAAPLRDLVALVRPWYRDGDGIDEAPSATVTLRLQDPAGDPNVPHQVHELATGTIGIDLREG
jgi:hypothetical protein